MLLSSLAPYSPGIQLATETILKQAEMIAKQLTTD
jgi:hypothetical protein